MRKKAFEKLLKAAIILEAEEQGAKLSASEEPIPAEAQARFDAALNGAQKQERAELAETKKPEKRRQNWLSYGIAAVSAAALVLVVALMIGLRAKTRAPAESGTKDAEVKTEHEHSDPVPAPGGASAPAPEEIPEPAPEPINVIAELKEFFSENQTLLEHASEGNTLRLNYLHIVDGQALYQMPKSDPYSIANPKWFSTDVQALIEISAEGRFSFYWDAPSYFRHESNQPFVQGAKPCFGVKASENGDEEQSKHEAWLIYTENVQEQFAEPYRGKIQPLAENWYLYVADLEPEPEPHSEWPESIVDTWVIWEKIEANGETVEMDGRFDEMSLVFDANGKVTVTVYDQIEVVYYTVTGDTVVFTVAGESVLGQHDPYDSLTVRVPSTGETLVFKRESWAESIFEVSSNTYTADNGLSGIGNIRGNTNGNLQNGGRAVSDGKRIFYIDQTVDHLRICRYTLATGETTVLAERTDVDRRSAGYLNYASGVPDIVEAHLYFVIDESENLSSIMRLSLTDGSMKKIASDQNICGLFDVYGFLYCVTGSSTKELAANGMELGEIEDFRMIGAMGGLLYGMRGDQIAAINWSSHELVQSYNLDGDVSVVNGYLIAADSDPADETTVLTLLNVSTGTSETYRTGLYNASVENFSKDGIYLKEYGYLSVGPIWRMSWYGTGPECVDSRFYELGPTLWNDSFLNDFVPCDELAGETVEMPEGEPVLKVMVNEGNPRVYRREDTAIDCEIELRWEADKCILRYQPNHVAEGPLQYKEVPIGREIVVDIVYFDSGTQYRFWLAPEDAPLPDEWNAIIAENKRIEDAQAIFGTQEAFEASRDREAEIGMIAALIPEYRQTYADAETDRFAEDWYWPLLDALWRNGDVTVQFTDAKRVDDGDSITLVLTGDNGKTYEMYVYMGWLEAVSCDGKLIRFLL